MPAIARSLAATVRFRLVRFAVWHAGAAGLLAVALALAPGSAARADFLDSILDSAEDILTNTQERTEDKIENKADQGIDAVIDGGSSSGTPPANAQPAPAQPANPQAGAATTNLMTNPLIAPLATQQQPGATATGGQSNVEMSMEVQDRLNQLGYDAGPVDGQPGLKTAMAIAAFQRDKGMVEDGKVTPTLVQAVRAAHQMAQSAPPVATMDQAQLTQEAQTRLNALGYDAGPPDGVSGLKTAMAVAAFQRDKGIAEDGTVSPALVEALRVAK